MVLSRRGNEGGELPSLTATINMFRTCTMFVIPVFSCTGAFALSGTAMSSHSGAVQKQKSKIEAVEMIKRRQLMLAFMLKKRIVSNCIHAARWIFWTSLLMNRGGAHHQKAGPQNPSVRGVGV